MPSVRFTSTFDADRFSQELFQQIRSVIDEELLEAASELQQESPVGITGDLKAGWDLIPAKRRPNSFDVQGSIINTAKDAEYRIRGRGPGKFPPYGKGTPLERWARMKGIPPFLVARKIAEEGTDRYRDGDGNNFAGLKRDGSVTSDSPIEQASRRIRERLNQIKITSTRAKGFGRKKKR